MRVLKPSDLRLCAGRGGHSRVGPLKRLPDGTVQCFACHLTWIRDCEDSRKVMDCPKWDVLPEVEGT